MLTGFFIGLAVWCSLFLLSVLFADVRQVNIWGLLVTCSVFCALGASVGYLTNAF